MDSHRIFAMPDSYAGSEDGAFSYLEVGNPWRGAAPVVLTDFSSNCYKDELRKLPQAFDSWPRLILRSRGTILVGPRCAAFNTRARQFIVGSPLNWQLPNLQADVKEYSRLDITSMRFFERAVVIPAPGYRVYGHWLLDFMPRLLLARDYINACKVPIPIVMKKVPKWAWQFIEMLGLKDLIVEVGVDEPVLAEDAYFPLAPKEGYLCSHQALREGFDELMSHISDEPLSAYSTDDVIPKKLLVLRRKAPFAGNHRAIKELLESYGFSAIFPETLSLQDQIRVFKKAEIVIGEDGSAMHNIGFCRPNAQVVIWSRADRINLRHISVAQAAGVNLTMIKSQVSDDGSYEIDMEKIEEIMDKLISNVGPVHLL